MKHLSTLSVLCLLLPLCGCKDDKVSAYEIPKEAPETVSNPQSTEAVAAPAQVGAVQGSQAMRPLPGMAEQTAQFDTPTWKAPEGWETKPLGSMRKGSWQIQNGGQSAEVSVLAFPGDVGGELANVNRWAGQVGAQKLTAQELAAHQKENKIDVDRHPGHYYLLEGDAGQSIAAVIVPYHGGTWFFKMQGDSELVSEEAVNFGMFMSSVRFPAH